MNTLKRLTVIGLSASLLLPCLSLDARAETASLTALEAVNTVDGVLDLGEGGTWYKVKSLKADCDYIITVTDQNGKEVFLSTQKEGAESPVWHFKKGPSSSDISSTLSTDLASLSLTPEGAVLGEPALTQGPPPPPQEPATEPVTEPLPPPSSCWTYDGSLLSYTTGEEVFYLGYENTADEPFTAVTESSEAARVTLYSREGGLEACIKNQPAQRSYVKEGSGYAAPVFSISLKSRDIILDSINWYLDGEKAASTSLVFKADSLTDKEAGVHRVFCKVKAHDNNNYYYSETSAVAAFIITKGVVTDSVLTFSDIHEEYSLVTDAIEEVMDSTGGYIPALILYTGDMVNGAAPAAETMLSDYFPKMKPCLGGLDTVYVAGNHDSGEAIVKMNGLSGISSGDQTTAGGEIFRGSSKSVQSHDRNSAFAQGIVVYGLNYEACVREDGTFSYEAVLPDIESFLKTTAKDYKGETVIISAHSGLHVIGKEEASTAAEGKTLAEWAGGNAYNISGSYELTKLLNTYAEKYNMNILYLFGHDHSKGEAEFILSPGDSITGTKDYSKNTFGSQKLSFTYAHAGYLSTRIGSADAHFSFIYNNRDEIVYNFMSLKGEETSTTLIKAKTASEDSNKDADPEEVDYILGDVNGDNFADALDATEILKLYAAALLDGRVIYARDMPVANHFDDGYIDAKDATSILVAYAALLNE